MAHFGPVGHHQTRTCACTFAGRGEGKGSYRNSGEAQQCQHVKREKILKPEQVQFDFFITLTNKAGKAPTQKDGSRTCCKTGLPNIADDGLNTHTR